MWPIPAMLHMDWTLITSPPSQVAAPVVVWVGGWSLGRDIELETNLEHPIEKNRLMAREAAQAQMMAMKNYLDPHFIFNTLNAIAEWCTEDPKTAENAITHGPWAGHPGILELSI
ncbi:MAG: histidine kinase [Deltaproteobacteria bacterium]|nr:histidine kinase [Deltaproteobacteria bacterium]